MVAELFRVISKQLPRCLELHNLQIAMSKKLLSAQVSWRRSSPTTFMVVSSPVGASWTRLEVEAGASVTPAPTLPRQGAADFWATCMHTHLLIIPLPSDATCLVSLQHSISRTSTAITYRCADLRVVTNRLLATSSLPGQPFTPRDDLQLDIDPGIGQQHGLYS
jgi:hypothetical protein